MLRICVKGYSPVDNVASVKGVPLKGEMNMSLSVVAEGKANPQNPLMRLSVETKRGITGTTTQL